MIDARSPLPKKVLSQIPISDLKSAIRNPKSNRFSGGGVERVTPVPIPNTEVKPLGADGTARATAWESRKPPGLLNEKPAREISRAFPLTTFLSAISNFLHPLRLHVTKSRRNLRR